MKLHQKGFLLVELNAAPDGLWDDELVRRTLRDYGQSGSYWEKSIRIALEELAAAGLTARLQSKLVNADGAVRLSFQYAMTDFGRTRMRDTGLTSEARV